MLLSRQKREGVVAPRSGWPGRHAGHVLRLEKGSRAVKGLQQHTTGSPGRQSSAESGGTYL